MFAIKVRDATLTALRTNKHWMNKPPINEFLVKSEASVSSDEPS